MLEIVAVKGSVGEGLLQIIFYAELNDCELRIVVAEFLGFSEDILAFVGNCLKLERVEIFFFGCCCMGLKIFDCCCMVFIIV